MGPKMPRQALKLFDEHQYLVRYLYVDCGMTAAAVFEELKLCKINISSEGQLKRLLSRWRIVKLKDRQSAAALRSTTRLITTSTSGSMGSSSQNGFYHGGTSDSQAASILNQEAFPPYWNPHETDVHNIQTLNNGGPTSAISTIRYVPDQELRHNPGPGNQTSGVAFEHVEIDRAYLAPPLAQAANYGHRSERALHNDRSQVPQFPTMARQMTTQCMTEAQENQLLVSRVPRRKNKKNSTMKRKHKMPYYDGYVWVGDFESPVY